MEIAGAADDSNTLITLGRRYIYDGWSVVEERTFDNSATLGNSPNTLERVYVNGRSIDEPLLAAIDGDSDEFLNTNKNTTNGVNLVDAEYYYLSNRLGSISAILDADNQNRILEYYRYEVFGSATVLPIVDTNTDGLEDTPLDLNDNNAAGPALVSSFGNTYLYTARRFDDVTGLYYYRNRYYDPRSGRFITRDPARSPWGNLYGYVKNATTFYRDTFGLACEHVNQQLAASIDSILAIFVVLHDLTRYRICGWRNLKHFKHKTMVKADHDCVRALDRIIDEHGIDCDKLRKKYDEDLGGAYESGRAEDGGSGATVCVMWQSKRETCCRHENEIHCCPIVKAKNEGETEEYGVTPQGEYLIGGPRTDDPDSEGFHRLFMKKKDGTYAKYHEEVGPNGGKGTRDLLQIHPGDTSWGCVTVEHDSCWKKLDAIILKGNVDREHHQPEQAHEGFNGFLHVLP